MKKFRFRKFAVYQDSREYMKFVQKILQNFPSEERFRLVDQTSRALTSILLNIAEGADRSTDKDFALFLNRAHTSINEVVACFDVALDFGYVSSEDHEEILKKSESIANQLTAFRKSLL